MTSAVIVMKLIVPTRPLTDSSSARSVCSYSPFTKRWALALASSRIRRFSRFYRTQCSAVKLEIWKRVQKGYLNWGSNRTMHCCRQGQTAWILMGFPNSVLLGQNLAEILFFLWLAFWRNRLQKHNWKTIP